LSGNRAGGAVSALEAGTACRDSLGTTIRVALEFTHPITWFAAMRAYLCGAIAGGRLQFPGSLPLILVGIVLGGLGLTALSQVINDYCDRDVTR